MEKLLIGEILKPHGIRGEVKMKNYTDGFFAISGLKEIYLEDQPYRVLKIRADKDVYLLLSGIADRNSAETLRGKRVFADKSKVKREKNTYFICDVIGCNVVLTSGEEVGRITDILSARTDIYYIDTPQGKAIFPLIPQLNANFDIEARKVTVETEVFKEEVRYED